MSRVRIQKNISRAAKKMANAKTFNKEIIEQTRKLEEAKQNLEETYGIAGLEAETEANPTKLVVEYLIDDLKTRTLNEKQLPLFKTHLAPPMDAFAIGHKSSR